MKKYTFISWLLIVLSLIFILIGVIREEHQIVFTKAINICLECIGLG